MEVLWCKVWTRTRESGLATGHEQGVYIANNQPKTKDKLTANANNDELIDKATEDLLDEKQKAREAEWKAKMEKTALRYYRSDWKGPEFAQIKYTGWQ